MPHGNKVSEFVNINDRKQFLAVRPTKRKHIKTFPVPIVFVEGRHDYHVSSDLAKEYFNTIVTPKHFFWFEHSCYFPQWSKSEKFTNLMCAILKSETHGFQITTEKIMIKK